MSAFHISIGHNQREDGRNVEILMCLFLVQAFALTVSTEKSIQTVCYYLRRCVCVGLTLINGMRSCFHVCLFFTLAVRVKLWDGSGRRSDASHAFTSCDYYNPLIPLTNGCFDHLKCRPAPSQMRPLKVTRWKRASVTRAEDAATEGPWT